MGIVPDRWALLRIRFEGPYVVLRLLDNEGDRTTAHSQWITGPTFVGSELGMLSGHLQRLASGLPGERPGPHNTGPVPLALFIDLPPFLQGDQGWTRIDRELLPMILDAGGPDRVQPLTFAGSIRRLRPAFSLPFDILAHGPSARNDLDVLRERSWMQLESVQNWGFRLTDIEAVDASSLEGALRDRDRDILITSEARTAFAVCRSLSLRRRPRLIVVKEVMGREPALPPRGTAAIWVPAMERDPRVGELLFGLVHDLPIHEAIRAAERRFGIAPALPIRVFADPWTNQSLRIRDALVSLHAEAERLDIRLPRVDLDEFLERVRSQSEGAARLQITALQRRLTASRWLGFAPGGDEDPLSRAGRTYIELAQMRQIAAEARTIPEQFEYFEQEGTGLIPMTERLASLAQLANRAEEAVASIHLLAAHSDLERFLADHQQRTVDMALQRLDTSPLLSSLDRHTTLAIGATYRLRVHLGNPLPDSLVIGERPPIDLLLPDTDDESGHLLDVVLQGKQFSIVSEASRSLRLPRLGSSDPVYFAVRAPEQSGPASLRVHLYYRNHLVQTYILEAQIDKSEERRADADVLRVSLSYTRVRRLEDIDVLQPRALSIGANDSGRGTHELILKGGQGSTAELTLASQTYDIEVRKFRRSLDDAARDPTNPTTGRTYPIVAPGAVSSRFVADTIRSFARQGTELYEAVFRKASRSNPGIRKQLVALRTMRDEKIQIVRMDDNFVFPWTLLYDFTLPNVIAGGPDPPVCLGTIVDAAGKATPCAHTPDAQVICINGFWSIRHYVEELIGRGVDADPTVTCPAADSVRVVCDSTLPGAAQFEKAMRALITAPHLALGPVSEATLLDLLWQDPPVRPSILVVVGHLETARKTGEPESPRVVLVPASEWLTRKRLSDRAKEADGWTQPRSVVLLMACEAVSTSAATVNDFVTSLALAGAAAVVGAEAVVPSGLAMRCAEDLTRALWARQTLGEAMTAFRRRLLSEGNPLGFVFHAVGSVDLTLN